MLDKSNEKKLQNLGQHYVGHCIDEDVLENSSSGGMFTVFARKIFELRGCVFGAAFDNESYKIHHVKAENENELKPLRKSKYVWSDWTQCILDIKKAMNEERYILFTGTPCQGASIQKLFGSYEKLFIVDVFCHGTAEPRFFEAYLKMINTKVTAIDFRGQSTKSIDNYNFRIWDNTGIIIDNIYNENVFTSLYTNSAIIRDVCFTCNFASKRHLTDITIGDYSFIDKSKRVNINIKHPSIVAVNTDKGKKLLDMCLDMLNLQVLDNKEEIDFYYRPHNTLRGEWGYNREKRNKFLSDYDEYGFTKAAISAIYPREIHLIDKLKSKMYNSKEILLYGNGYVGRRLFSLIKQLYPKWNIACFLTSKKTEESLINDIPVFSINDMKFMELNKSYFTNVPSYQIDDVNILDNQIVVISVSENHIDAIEEELKKRKINNYIK